MKKLKALLQGKSEICLSKTWESDCGTVTVKTCRAMETLADFVARHNSMVEELMKLCPPTE